MKFKEIIHDIFDIDRSLAKTFVTLFVNPKEVIDNPGRYMKPWHYATYVVTISSLMFWTVIHLLGDPTENHLLWAMPERVLNLTNGNLHFYENTQPLKRLLLGAFAFYIGILVAFYNNRKSLFTIALYLTGQSVFLVFIVQSMRMIILGGGVLNSGDSITGILTHGIYLTYAAMNVFRPKWWVMAPKVILVTIIYYGIYPIISSLGIHNIYYQVLNGNANFYDPRPDYVSLVSRVQTTEIKENGGANTFDHSHLKHLQEGPSQKSPYALGQWVSHDSLQLAIQFLAPLGEVSEVFVSCHSNKDLHQKWSTNIFKKVDRYSPDSSRIFLRLDSAHKTVLAFYRISNNRNSTIRVTAIDIRTGTVNYRKDIDVQADDLSLNDVAVDEDDIYLCGGVSNLYGKFGLGFVIRLDPATGEVKARRLIGETNFSSLTSFEHMKIVNNKLVLTTSRDYKRLMYFRTIEWTKITVDKSELLQ